MIVFWLIWSISMGALLGVNIALYEEPVRDWLTTRYGEWYRARHPLPAADRERLVAAFDPAALQAFATFGVSAREMSETMRQMSEAMRQAR